MKPGLPIPPGPVPRTTRLPSSGPGWRCLSHASHGLHVTELYQATCDPDETGLTWPRWAEQHHPSPPPERWGSRGRRFKSCRPDQRLRRSEAVSAVRRGRPFGLWSGSNQGALWEPSCSQSRTRQPCPVCPSPVGVDVGGGFGRCGVVGRCGQPWDCGGHPVGVAGVCVGLGCVPLDGFDAGSRLSCSPWDALGGRRRGGRVPWFWAGQGWGVGVRLASSAVPRSGNAPWRDLEEGVAPWVRTLWSVVVCRTTRLARAQDAGWGGPIWGSVEVDAGAVGAFRGGLRTGCPARLAGLGRRRPHPCRLFDVLRLEWASAGCARQRSRAMSVSVSRMPLCWRPCCGGAGGPVLDLLLLRRFA